MKKGFTLVELLITITIVTVVVASGVSAYGRARDRQILQASVEKLISTLQGTQKQALIGDKDSSCVDNLLGYQTTFSANTLTTQVRCSGGNSSAVNTAFTSITFTSPFPTITFRPLGQGVIFGTGGSVDTIDFSYQGRSYSVEVDESGNIQYLGEQ